MSSTLLEVAHISMQFSDTDKQVESDAKKIFGRAASREQGWVTGTEAWEQDHHDIMARAARLANFRFAIGPGQDAWVAVNKDLMVPGTFDTYYSGTIVPGKKHQYTNKGVFGVSFDTEKMGQIAVNPNHFLTKGDPSAPDPQRHVNIPLNRELAREINRWGQKFGAGSGLAFSSGDFNILDRLADVFLGSAKFTTCWDELGKWPNTGHGNIDAIASWNPDGRVSCDSADVLDDKEFPLFTDHWYMWARYNIRNLSKKKVAKR